MADLVFLGQAHGQLARVVAQSMALIDHEVLPGYLLELGSFGTHEFIRRDEYVEAYWLDDFLVELLS